jgi:hypothetical protein
MLLATARAKPGVRDLMIVLFAAASGLYASRNLPVSSLLLTLVISPLLGEGVARSTDPPASPAPGLPGRFQAMISRMASMEKRMRGHLWPAAGLLAGLAICSHDGRLGAHQIMNASFSDQRFPVHAVEAIKERHIPGPIFAPDYWGGYLIYRLYPEVEVVADDRHDLYGEQFFRNYLKIMHVEPGWEELLKRDHVTWVLLPAQSSLAGILTTDQNWSVEYRDEVAILLKKTSQP